ncbi:MAG: APC family permease [Actinomycetota bacterium]|nr:APC family permease [Actinomycetota bacterium]
MTETSRDRLGATQRAGHDRMRLAKVIGVGTVVASAVANEYGSGINFVAPQSVGAYPGVHGLVPLAILATGIVLLPKVYLFMRFGKAMPTSGSTFGWISRTLSLPVAFITTVVWLAGVAGGIGVVSFAAGTFLAQTLASSGIPGSPQVSSAIGHIIVGLGVIWVVFGLHVAGVRAYSIAVKVLLGVIIASAVTVVVFALVTPAAQFLTNARHVTGMALSRPHSSGPTVGGFISVMALLVFAYGGINAAPTLGGEAQHPRGTLPRGILLAWAAALVLYSSVTFAVFIVMPWWSVPQLAKHGHTALTTIPGVMSLIAPRAVSAIFSLVVTVIVAKTLVPQFMATSRTLFALGQDLLLPEAFARTNRHKAPTVALAVTAAAGSCFLVETALTGFTAGVVIRSLGILVVLAVLGAGVLNVRFVRPSRFWGKSWATEATGGPLAPVAAILGIAIAIVLVRSVIVLPHKALLYQPWLQALIAILVGALLYFQAVVRAKRLGVALSGVGAEPPVE